MMMCWTLNHQKQVEMDGRHISLLSSLLKTVWNQFYQLWSVIQPYFAQKVQLVTFLREPPIYILSSLSPHLLWLLNAFTPHQTSNKSSNSLSHPKSRALRLIEGAFWCEVWVPWIHDLVSILLLFSPLFELVANINSCECVTLGT
jgi:hypothetical protein